MNKKIAIILINYKDYVNRFLDECRDSLRAQDYPKEFFNVYIVDNASSDSSIAYTKDCFPEAVILPRADGNYSAANNVGIKKGLEDGCEYFVIANMDTKFAVDWLSSLVRGLEENPQAGMVQSKMLLYPQNADEWKHPRINGLGNIMHFLCFGFTSGYKEPDKEINGYPEIDGYASGCSYITKKEVIEKIGYYNEDYFMYHDDVEMSWKAKLAGYKIFLAPRSIVYHKYEFGRSMMMLYYIERNRIMTFFSFYRWPTIVLLLPALAAMEIGMFFYAMASGWTETKIKIYSYFLKLENWKKIIRFRRQIKRIRTVKDKEIIKNFSGKILFQEVNNPILEYAANPLFNLYWQFVKIIIFW